MGFIKKLVLAGAITLLVAGFTATGSAPLKFMLQFSGLFNFLFAAWAFFAALLFLSLLRDGTVFKKIFLPIMACKGVMVNGHRAVYYGAFTVALSLAVLLLLSLTEIRVVSSHRCVDDKMEVCRINQSTLRTLYLPVFKSARDIVPSSYSEENNVYFSAGVAVYSGGPAKIFLGLLLLPILVARWLKLVHPEVDGSEGRLLR